MCGSGGSVVLSAFSSFGEGVHIHISGTGIGGGHVGKFRMWF